ncbi:MAG: hypothetical protein GJ680_01030 [Alteromonadaceae bacterium]|nr:hypothetical protein [Alteromonadaceae bacterium]
MVRVISLLAMVSLSVAANTNDTAQNAAQSADAIQPVNQIWTASSSERYQGKETENIKKSSAPTQSLKKAEKNLSSDASSNDKTDNTNLQQMPAKSFAVDASQVVLDHEYWIYDATLRFIEDWDHDGYFYRFELGFDVDTVYSHGDVYARLYLGDGHTFREYHTTSVFHIDTTDSDDKFFVDTELLAGFPSHDYDIMIELYDAYNDHLVAVYDHTSDGDLSYNPLESYDYEAYVVPSTGGTVTVSRERGGSSGWLMFGLGLLSLVMRNIRISKSN